MEGQHLLAAVKWLIARLIDDSVISILVARRVYQSMAPEIDPVTGESPAYPLIVVHVSHTEDIKGMGGVTIGVIAGVEVRVIGKENGFDELQPIEKRVNNLLDAPFVEGISVDAVNYSMNGCTRIRSRPPDAQVFNGDPFFELGGTWRIDMSEEM